MSLGIALALRLDGLEDTAHVFTICSDGDCQEGQTWEAATAAPHSGVSNLTAIVDYNHLQTDGTTEEVMDIGDMAAKFSAFGWDTVEIDGHDMTAIVDALEHSRTVDRPSAIIAQTMGAPAAWPNTTYGGVSINAILIAYFQGCQQYNGQANTDTVSAATNGAADFSTAFALLYRRFVTDHLPILFDLP
jgi:hypothetical protein